MILAVVACPVQRLSVSSRVTVASLEDTFRKVPPQSLDAEESVLGGILLDTNALDRVIEVMSVDDFYRESHRKIFRAMLAFAQCWLQVPLLSPRKCCPWKLAIDLASQV